MTRHKWSRFAGCRARLRDVLLNSESGRLWRETGGVDVEVRSGGALGWSTGIRKGAVDGMFEVIGEAPAKDPGARILEFSTLGTRNRPRAARATRRRPTMCRSQHRQARCSRMERSSRIWWAASGGPRRNRGQEASAAVWALNTRASVTKTNAGTFLAKDRQETRQRLTSERPCLHRSHDEDLAHRRVEITASFQFFTDLLNWVENLGWPSRYPNRDCSR